MRGYRAEFMVEPFVEGSLGPPVAAAVEAVRDHGFDPLVEAFGTTIEGEADRVVAALADMLHAAMAAGATRVNLQVERQPET
jgi:uncharacterized protein YqgV (UPF0045/DUF77 family)